MDTATETPLSPAIEKLTEAIETVLNDGSIRQVFELMRLNNRLSMRNAFMVWADYIYRSKEDPSRYPASGPVSTLGAKGWLEKGRPLKPGVGRSDAIVLLAPVKRNIWIEDEETGKKVKRLRCVGFKLIQKTYHIQDTVGDIPQPVAPKPITDDTETERSLCKWLCRTALDDLGVTKISRDAKTDAYLRKIGAYGCYTPKTQAIKVTTDIPMGHAAAVLTHEIAHHMAKHADAGHNQVAAETIAEGVAFIVMGHFGYDTSSFTAPYIGQYASDMAKVRAVLEDIDKIAKVIIQKVTKRMEDK